MGVTGRMAPSAGGVVLRACEQSRSSESPMSQVAGDSWKGRKTTVPHDAQACAAHVSPLVMSRRRFEGHSLPLDHQRCCQENPNSRKPGLVPRTPIAPRTICSPQAGHVIPTVIGGNLSTPPPTKIGHSLGGGDSPMLGGVETSGSEALPKTHRPKGGRDAGVGRLYNESIEVERDRSTNDWPTANRAGSTLLDRVEVCERVYFDNDDWLGSLHC